MDVKEKLLSELLILCKDAAVDFTKTSQELIEFIGDKGLIEYYATRGPLPNFPDTVVDILLLGNNCLYDYEIKQQGSLQHIAPLRTIIDILEGFQKQENEDYLSVSFRVASLGTGIVLQGKLADKNNIRRFSGAVARKLGEIK